MPQKQCNFLMQFCRIISGLHLHFPRYRTICRRFKETQFFSLCFSWHSHYFICQIFVHAVSCNFFLDLFLELFYLWCLHSPSFSFNYIMLFIPLSFRVYKYFIRYVYQNFRREFFPITYSNHQRIFFSNSCHKAKS